VLALKPTWGRLSRAGHVPPAPGKDAESEIGVVGPMARSARDLRLLWRVLAESPATAATVPSLQGRVLALWTEGFVLERRVKRMVEAAALSLEGLGARIAPIAAPVDLARMMPAYRDLIAAIPRHGAPAHDLGVRERLAAGLGAVRRALGAPAFSRAGFALANAASAARLARARDARARMKARMATLFETTHAIIAPTVFRPAFPHDHAGGMEDRTLLADGAVVPYFALIDWIALASVLDLPAISVPFGATPEGLPIGVQVIGPWGSEERLLDIAELLELTGRGFVAPQL
jgi:amidase